jgi:hypothetical protein
MVRRISLLHCTPRLRFALRSTYRPRALSRAEFGLSYVIALSNAILWVLPWSDYTQTVHACIEACLATGTATMDDVCDRVPLLRLFEAYLKSDPWTSVFFPGGPKCSSFLKYVKPAAPYVYWQVQIYIPT